MRGVSPWPMLGIDLPPGVTRGGWYGNAWTGPNKNVHEVEGVLFFVPEDMPKPELIGLIKDAKARWEPHDVNVTFFPDLKKGDAGALWSSDDPLLKTIGLNELARLWDVPREMVEGLC